MKCYQREAVQLPSPKPRKCAHVPGEGEPAPGDTEKESGLFCVVMDKGILQDWGRLTSSRSRNSDRLVGCP